LRERACAAQRGRMDELQDAIEDAQYMSAVHEDTLKPTKRWKYPSAERTREFIERLEAHKADALGFDALAAQCLGLYQMYTFCTSEVDAARPEAEQQKHETDADGDAGPGALAPAAKVVMAFMTDVIRYKRARSVGARHELFISMFRSFFRAERSVEYNGVEGGELWRPLPKVDPADVEQAYAAGFDEAAALHGVVTALPIQGEEVERVVSAYENVKGYSHDELRGSKELRRSVHASLRGDLFDMLDYMCALFMSKHVYPAFRASPSFDRLMKFLCIQQQPVTEDDFGLFRIIGRGGFGLVHGCKKRTSGKLYAMKVLNKKRIKMRGSEKLCMNERRILAEVDSPFLVCLKYSFATNEDLFLILDLMTGGDLAFHLSIKGVFNKIEATFYAMRCALALRHLHKLDIVYRDLKPDNILMDDFGNIKLTDLGLAVKWSPKLTGVAGTRGYWAPEMIRKDPDTGRRGTYGKAVDWWSFGCLIYEFTLGKCPFRTRAAKEWGGGSDREKNMDKATQEMQPDYCDHKDEDFVDICRRLLTRDPTTRLGVQSAEEVLTHPYFKDLDYHAMEADQVKPPMKPPKDINAMSQSEIGDFQDESDLKRTELTDEDHAVYQDFNWISPRAFQVEVIEYLVYEAKMGGEANVIRHTVGDNCCVIL